MSLPGYKSKQKKAPWFSAQAPAPAPAKPSRPVRRVSKRRQATTAEYRCEARAFVAMAIDLGQTCPVVAVVPELRDGRKYGHPVSARLNEVHHIRGRAGTLLLDKRGWIAMSKQGHRWVHEHPEKARAFGFLCERGLWGVPFNKKS